MEADGDRLRGSPSAPRARAMWLERIPADAAVHVPDRELGSERPVSFDCRSRALLELPVQGIVEHPRRRFDTAARSALGQLHVAQDVRQVHAAGLPMLDRLADCQQVDPADRFVERAQAERGQDLAHFLGHEEEEVDDVLRGSLKALAQLRILGGNSRPDTCSDGRARIITHPVAIRGAARKPISSAPSIAAIDHVAARLQLPVRLHDDAASAGRSTAASAESRPNRSPMGRPRILDRDSGEAPVPPS